MIVLSLLSCGRVANRPRFGVSSNPPSRRLPRPSPAPSPSLRKMTSDYPTRTSRPGRERTHRSRLRRVRCGGSGATRSSSAKTSSAARRSWLRTASGERSGIGRRALTPPRAESRPRSDFNRPDPPRQAPFACRSPDKGDLVQPRESFDFKLYYDEDRTYIVANAQGRTFGCVTVLWPLVSARIRIHSGSDAVSARHAVDLASREDQCASAQPDPGRSDVWVSQCSGMSPEHCRGAEVVERLVWPFASAPFRASGVQGRSGRWCRSQAMTAHDFADLFDVRRAIAS